MAKHDRRIKYTADIEKPVMVSVRVPRELYERLERYAGQHRQSISDLVKDGIEMRLDVEADPRSRKAESTTEEPLEQDGGASLLRDIQATLARHESQMAALMQAIELRTTPGSNGLYDSVSSPVIHGHTAMGPERTAEQEPERGTASMDTMAGYDTSRYHLGKLCPKGHDYSGSGHSLRNTASQCRACTVQAKRDKRAQGKAALHATTMVATG